MGVMAGAIASHVFILGIDVKGGGGLLFGLALTAFVGSIIVLVCADRRFRLSVGSSNSRDAMDSNPFFAIVGATTVGVVATS